MFWATGGAASWPLGVHSPEHGRVPLTPASVPTPLACDAPGTTGKASVYRGAGDGSLPRGEPWAGHSRVCILQSERPPPAEHSRPGGPPPGGACGLRRGPLASGHSSCGRGGGVLWPGTPRTVAPAATRQAARLALTHLGFRLTKQRTEGQPVGRRETLVAAPPWHALCSSGKAELRGPPSSLHLQEQLFPKSDWTWPPAETPGPGELRGAVGSSLWWL